MTSYDGLRAEFLRLLTTDSETTDARVIQDQHYDR